jgi:hypothetical protein
MSRKHPRVARIAALGLGLGAITAAVAPPSVAAAAPSSSSSSSASASPQGGARERRARTSLRLDTGRTKAWAGEPVPITITAQFRDVEGVTLEGAPQLHSKAIMTSNVAHEPRQSTEIVDGERTLVVRWSGTVTPSTPGPLDLSVDLPVRIRYREVPPRGTAQARPQDLLDDDPFAGLGSGDSLDAIFDKMQRRMMERIEVPSGPVREQALPLQASAKDVEVRALPAAGRPPGFSGAVGQFEIESSVSSSHVNVSEPVTVRIVVSGNVDLDRVDLPGVAGSGDWKSYPPRASTESPPKGAPRKIFEQVLVPLHGGNLTVPPVSFSAFDPASGTYVTHATHPISIAVDGAAAPAAVAPTAAPAAVPVAAPAPPASSGPVIVTSTRDVGVRVAPVLAFVLAAGIARALRRRRGDWSLRRTMRRAASGGDVSSFLASAHALVTRRLAAAWGVPPEEVTSRSVRDRLGERGRPLAEVLHARETLRFARGGVGEREPDALRDDLGALCTSVERSLRGAA